MRIKTAKPGFTMVELLVVVLILAILITVIISVSHAVVARGKAETTRRNMQLVLEGIDAFAETDTSRVPPVERGLPGLSSPNDAFPNFQGAQGTRDPAFLPSNTDSDNNWLAFLRAKYLSMQLLGGTETVAGVQTQFFGNAAAKVKLSNAPTGGFSCNYTECNNIAVSCVVGSPTELPLFIDAYGKYMDYSSSRGAGSAPVLISAGPDGKFNTEDDIRSDRR